MCARAYKIDLVPVKLIDQQEIAPDMTLTMVRPFALQGVIEIVLHAAGNLRDDQHIPKRQKRRLPSRYRAGAKLERVLWPSTNPSPLISPFVEVSDFADSDGGQTAIRRACSGGGPMRGHCANSRRKS
jgi:hypothetical protein